MVVVTSLWHSLAGVEELGDSLDLLFGDGPHHLQTSEEDG